MSLFLRNLAKCGKDVVIEDRTERIISGKPREVFSNPREDRMRVKTLRGVTVFDGTNTETIATHKLCGVWRDDVTAEQWVRFVHNDKRLRILTVENCCEEDERIILMCTERGDSAQVVNGA